MTRASPSSGRSRQESIEMVVVLPAPFGPSRLKISPFSTAEIDALDGLAFAKGFVQVLYFDGFFHNVPPNF